MRSFIKYAKERKENARSFIKNACPTLDITEHATEYKDFAQPAMEYKDVANILCYIQGTRNL